MPDPTPRKGSRHEHPAAELLNAPRISRYTQLELQRVTEREVIVAAAMGDETFRFVLEDRARELDGFEDAQVNRILYRVCFIRAGTSGLPP